jgi:large repetitive protein
VKAVGFKLGSALLTSGLLLIAAACGGSGGSSGGGGGNPPPPPVIHPLAISGSLPAGLAGQPYSGKLQATGGTPPYTWSTPLLGINGLDLAADGTISGTPSSNGTFLPNFTVTDASNRTMTGAMEIDIYGPFGFTTRATLASQNIALPAWFYISANGGKAPYTYRLASGSAMPPGLTFADSGGVGLIQGTPTTPGTYSFTVEVTDTFSPPEKISQLFTLDVLNGLVLPLTTLPDPVKGLAYQEQIQPAGGTPPYHYVLAQWSPMPPGLTLNTATGRVAGTPTTVGDTWITVLITDSAPSPATINPLIALNVQPPLSLQTTSLPDSARGLNYATNLNIVGGRAPYTTQVISGALPDGLTLSPSPYPNSYNLTGVPTKDGLFGFTVQLSDSYEVPNTVRQAYQVRISDQMNMTGPSYSQILYNQNYNATFAVTGGFPPYKWSIDAVPAGLNFDTSTGTLSGVPHGVGYFLSIINAQDSSNPPLHANYAVLQLVVYERLRVSTSNLPPVAAGSAVWLGLQSAGGAFPITWSVPTGPLPAGITFDTSTGTLHGVPTTPGTYPVTFAISDGNTGSLHQTSSLPLTIAVKDRTQLQRNETLAAALPLSSIRLLASISPYFDASTSGPDVDVYRLSATPGTIVNFYVDANNDFIQPPLPNSMLPVLEVVDANETRYQTCTPAGVSGGGLTYTHPCINGLDGTFYSSAYYDFQVPGTGTTPVTFYVRVSEARGDARPDFIYTLSVFGAN